MELQIRIRHEGWRGGGIGRIRIPADELIAVARTGIGARQGVIGVNGFIKGGGRRAARVVGYGMRCRCRRIELAEPDHKRDIACGHGLRHGVAAVLDRPAEQRMKTQQRHAVDHDIGERRQIDELAFVKAERRIGGQAVNADDLDGSLPKGQLFPAGGQREVLGGHFFRRG